KAFFAADACRSELADELVRMANSDETFVRELGVSIRRAGATSGSMHHTSDGIRALLAVPLAGRVGRGVLYVNGLRTPGRWWFASITLHVSDRQLSGGPGTSPSLRLADKPDRARLALPAMEKTQ
ncbi:MAG TPA: hypothetical protein VF057_08505, partial [Thermoanaerobaculia bacterium]